MGSRVLVSIGAAAATLGAVVLACAFLPITSGCYGHQCDFSAADYGQQDGEGELVQGDPGVWETMPITGNWLPYPHNHTIVIHPLALVGRSVTEVRVYISPNENADAPGSNFTTAAGNLAEVAVFPGAINVHNDTCADFFMRAVVSSGTLDASDGGPDAGTDAPTDADEGGN